MKNYSIKYCCYNKYSAIIYSTSFYNPLENVNDISKDLSHNLFNSCFILFDLLLSNGNSFNRFVEVYFNGKEIEKSSIHIVTINNTSNLSYINSHYKNRFHDINNSILSPSEKLKLLKS